MSDRWQALQNSIAEWSTPTFPDQSISSKITHLRRELSELDANPTDISEFADCFMLLMDTARIAGFDMTEIFEATTCKLWINKGRRWGPPDADGVCQHIDDDN